jgi:hypothetical protein
MKPYQPEEVIVEQGSEASPIYRNLRRNLPNVPFRFVDEVARRNDDRSWIADRFGAAKRKLYLAQTQR